MLSRRPSNRDSTIIRHPVQPPTQAVQPPIVVVNPLQIDHRLHDVLRRANHRTSPLPVRLGDVKIPQLRIQNLPSPFVQKALDRFPQKLLLATAQHGFRFRIGRENAPFGIGDQMRVDLSRHYQCTEPVLHGKPAIPEFPAPVCHSDGIAS